ncbi:PREDICTED: gem-associated protein 4 [Nanorana parkeri]|uniref:gem-associated protein 4 n=1 Tax=Nanorana parkeri TaxID=125878 RepID=UPI000854AC26|nr:PREDICTED: gem-associated protein 4 [Nanorana parkeri]
MDFGYWNVCEQTVVLQGALLLAEKLAVHRTLLEFKKSDWPLIEKPITDALKEISSGNWSKSHEWRKRAIAIFWAKIISCRSQLSLDAELDIERKWKQDVFFAVGNMMPKINRTILYEILKATKAADIFAELLLVLPADLWVDEVSLLLDHLCSETSIGDVTFFMDVWWELMKGYKHSQDETVKIFSAVAVQCMSEINDNLLPSSKRFKPDPEQSLPAADSVLAAFLDRLHQMKPCIANTKLKCYTIANLADMLCSSAFLEKESGHLPIRQYLEKLVAVLCFCNAGAKNIHPKSYFPESIREAERVVQSGNIASKFRLTKEAQHFSLNLLKDLLLEWVEELHNYMNNNEEMGYECYRMNSSLASLQKILFTLECSEQGESGLEIAKHITSLQEKTAMAQLKYARNDMDTMAVVAMNIIKDKLERYEEVCFDFASEVTWVFTNNWFNCLNKNKERFRDAGLIFKLLETVDKAVSEQSNENNKQNEKCASIVLDLYCELPLENMNDVLMKVLCKWGMKGLSHCMTAFTNHFHEELNMTFNQISQNVTDDNPVTRVARLAVLHPEHVVSRACHIAVTNLGAHVFLSKILTSLPALGFRNSNTEVSESLLCKCLMETCWSKLSSDKEESQFLYLLASLMGSSENAEKKSASLLQPAEVVRTFVLPYLLDECSHLKSCLHILHKALDVENPPDASDKHWVLSCSPFPLIMSLCKLLNSYSRCWQHSDQPYCLTLESKELIIAILTRICTLILPEANNSAETWNKSLFWLHRKMEHIDWVVRLRMKPMFGKHFKYEVPACLFEVCKLSEKEWTTLHLPEYGLGTGLLAWMECCSISGDMKDQMLSLLCVNIEDPEEVNLFSKGFLVAMVQVLPWCSLTECKLLSDVVRTLLEKQLLHVPYTLEYVQFMPLLNLRPFACHLQYSVLLLRVFQLLCSSSCSNWLTLDGQKHLARLYSGCISDMLDGVKQQLSDCSLQLQKEPKAADYVQEVLFLYSQVFCHVLHIIAMMQENTCEPLFFLSLEILTLYETIRASDTSKNSLLRKANDRHFLKTITESVSNEHHRSTLMQKINKL